MKVNKDEFKLIYILKVGTNTKGEGLYEFIFSKDPSNIRPEDWGWDISPAEGNASPPEEEYIDAVYSLQTNKFNLNCLHESYDREYMHGYHLIHCLAYEEENDEEYLDNGFGNWEKLLKQGDEFDEEYNEDTPLLVFHYGMSLQQVEDSFYERNILITKNKNFDVHH